MAAKNYLKFASTGVLFVFVFSILGSVAGYLMRFVLTSNLTPAEYGLFYTCFSLLALLAIFRNLGLTQSIIYHISKFDAEGKHEKLRTSVFTVGLIQMVPAFLLSAFIFIFAETIAVNYPHLSGDFLKAATILKILAVAYFIQIFYDLNCSVFQGFQKMKLFSISDFSKAFLWFVLTGLFILLGYGVYSPALGFLTSLAILIPLLALSANKLLPKAKIRFSKKLTKSLCAYGFPIMLSATAGLVIGYTDTLLITFFRGLEPTGIYQAAQPTARLLWLFAGAFVAVLLPLTAEFKSKKLKSFEVGVDLIYRYIWILILPFALMAVAFSSEILTLFFGAFYAQGAFVLGTLAIGALFFSLTQINGAILNGLEQPKNYTRVVYLGMVVNLAGNLILIPKIGINGAAISTLLTYFLMLFFSFRELRKFVEIRLPLLDWTKTLLVGFFSLAVIYTLKTILETNIFLEVAICFVASLSVFAFLLVKCAVVNLAEVRSLVKGILRN